MLIWLVVAMLLYFCSYIVYFLYHILNNYYYIHEFSYLHIYLIVSYQL
jgi:hypothetical protein